MLKIRKFEDKFGCIRDSVFAANRPFIRFLLVGGLNTLFGYSVYGLLLFLGLNYMLAVLLSTVLGVFFNFKTIGCFVFRNNSWHLIVRFIIIYGVIYLLNLSILAFFNSIQFNLFIAQALAILPMAILSFVLNKKFVFEERTNEIN